MAPGGSFVVHLAEEQLLTKKKNELRKPLVEKMRRDWINSSIEQLKVLLEKEFHTHQPNSMLEKADILEEAVSYFKRQRQMQGPAILHKNSDLDYNIGYLRCLKETSHFLSFCEPKREIQAQLIKYFCKAHVITETAPQGGHWLPPATGPLPSKQETNNNLLATAVLWRPWQIAKGLTLSLALCTKGKPRGTFDLMISLSSI
uniref:Transcription factor HES-5 n=1 Tax=Salvator merianae TaxID=96440 RepID=A0A8D0BQB1_SALMN